MKKLLFIILLFSLNLQNYGQINCAKKDSTFIIYDFKTGKYDNYLINPRADHPIIFKIININRIAYDVNVNEKDVVVSQTNWLDNKEDLRKITDLFSESNPSQVINEETNVLHPKIIDNNEGGREKKDKIINDLKIIKKNDSLNVKIYQLQRDLDELKYHKKNFLSAKLFFSFDSINGSIKKDTTIFKKEIDELNKDIDTLTNKINGLTTQQKNIDNLKLKKWQDAKINFIDSYDTFLQSYNQVSSIVQASNKIIPFSNLPFLNKEDYRTQFQKEFRLIYSKLKNSDVSSEKINKLYTNLVVNYNKLKDIEGIDTIIGANSFKNFLNDVDALYESSKGMKLKTELIEFEKLSIKVQRIILLLEKCETYEYISEPIQPKNDIVTFDVEIISKDKEVEVNNSRKFQYSDFIKGGTRVDFSIGLAASYFINTEVYEIYTIDSENKVGLKSKNLKVPSLVTMISMTHRSPNYFAIGGSAGLGIDINSGKIQMSNFFIGPTLVIGKYDRMMFTPGVTFKNVGKLKNGIELDNTVLTQSNNINEVLTDDYKIGIFMALTYNLTKDVRNKISKMK